MYGSLCRNIYTLYYLSFIVKYSKVLVIYCNSAILLQISIINERISDQ